MLAPEAREMAMARLGRYFFLGQPLHVIQRGNNRKRTRSWVGVEIHPRARTAPATNKRVRTDDR